MARGRSQDDNGGDDIAGDEEQQQQPSWLDTDNDDQHRQEVEPLLFGTGTMNLADPEGGEEQHDNDDVEDDDETDLETAVLSAASGASKKSTYGSTGSSSPVSKSPKATAGTSDSSSKKLKGAKTKLLWPFVDNSQKKKPKSTRRVQATTQEDYDEEDPWPTSQNDKRSLKYNVKTGRPERPFQSCCLGIFSFVEASAILTCLCLLVSQTVPLVLVPWKELEPVDMVLKIYVSIFSILFMMVEFDWNIPFVRQSVLLQAYASRGFVYSFLGLTCLEEAYSERVNDMLAHANEKFHVAWFALFLQVSAWSLCALGVLYFVMGLFCMKRVRDRLVKEYRGRWKEYREALKEWKRNHVEDD